MSNRLSGETSPYLLQHRDNPVDWYPWGEEAFARAKTEDRPILLSVGYSACHWCHVMEHESFSDPDTASLMNEIFVNIKVDREERPDVDSLYMQAVQQMTGHGGWPMTVFLTPEGTPFYGGTYFPPEPRHGLPSFRQLLRAIGDAFRDRRDEVLQASSDLKELLLRGMLVNPEPTRLDEAVLHRAFHGLIGRFDPRYGGFGGAPKFPQPMLIDFLLRYWNRTGSEDALKTVERTLESMARGGIYDHLGGGFHRYSVDARWLVPHFEKMLYDNALLARAYLRAHQVTGREDFRRVVEEILEYVEREMRSSEGAFYSSQDADSEGQEGRFYVWSADEIDDVLGPDDGPIFRLHYDVTQHGNWEGESILNTGLDAEGIVGDVGLPPEKVQKVLERGRRILYEHRAKRVWPGRDDKVLTSWNAMMMHSFADAARGLGSVRYLDIAIQNAEFLLDKLRVGDRLMRSWRDGSARTEGFLEDYANLVDALLALYEASFDVRWVREARAIADGMVDLFWSESDEMFYDTAKDAEDLIIRPRDMYDNATPSGTSAAAHALIRLARLTGEASYERIASRVLAGLGDTASRVPQAFGHFLGALLTYFTPPTEVAIVGTPDDADTRALLRVVQSRYLPATTIAFRDVGGTDADLDTLLPMLAGRGTIDGMAAAYVCRHFACGRPVTAPEDLEREINETIPGPRKPS